MGINISMSIFKNPKFKAQFDEIKNFIDKDYNEYIESLPKKFFSEDGEEYEGSESFYPKFLDHYGDYGAISCIASPFTGEIISYILDFWEKISKKYFPEEIMLIDSPAGSYYVHKGKRYNILESILVLITDVLSKFNKPLQF